MSYHPNGVPLTPHEHEVLIILMEECSEVIQAASKLVRFGKENRPPDGPDAGTSNSRVLGLEIGDAQCLIDRALEAGLVTRKDIGEGFNRKTDRLAHFMQHPA